MPFTGVKLKVGKTSVRTSSYPSEPGFVHEINRAMKAIQKDMLYIIQQFEDVTAEFMLEVLQPAFDESQILVPKKTGALKNSGYLEIIDGTTGNQWVEIGYAKGGNPDYAVYVHEMVQIPHPPPTQAKFLEQPVNEALGSIIDDLASKYKEFAGF